MEALSGYRVQASFIARGATRRTIDADPLEEITCCSALEPRLAALESKMSSNSEPAADYHTSTQIVHEANGCVIAVWQDISIGIWGRSATLPLILQFESVRERISAQYPKTSSIHVLVKDAGLPEPDARKKLEAITAKAEARLIGVATVVTGSGFRVGALRSFLTSVHWLKRRPYEARICGSVRDAADWLAPLHSAGSVPVDAAALERLIQRLCERPSVGC